MINVKVLRISRIFYFSIDHLIPLLYEWNIQSCNSILDENLLASNTTTECSISCGKGNKTSVTVLCNYKQFNVSSTANRDQENLECKTITETRPCVKDEIYCQGTNLGQIYQ